jgi:Ca2+-binding EF-hand superfamily protein
VGFSLLSKNVPAKESLELAFSAFDVDNKGKISIEDFSRVFRHKFFPNT